MKFIIQRLKTIGIALSLVFPEIGGAENADWNLWIEEAYKLNILSDTEENEMNEKNIILRDYMDSDNDAALFLRGAPGTGKTYFCLNFIVRAQRQSSTAVVGLLIGLVGVGVTLGVWQGFGDSEPIAILALLLASLSYGIGAPYLRKFVTPMQLPPTATASVQVLTSAIILLPVYLLTGPLFIAAPTFYSAGSLLMLGVFGSGIAYWLFHQVVAKAGSAVAATVTYTNPVIATFWGVLLLSEGLHWYEPVGALLVLLGAYLSQGRKAKKN